MIKSTINNLRRQPVVSTVTIAGTALSIFLIMITVMMNQVKVAPFAPESNRDRLYYVDCISFGNTNWGDPEESNSNGPMCWRVVKELYKPLQPTEAVTGYSYAADPRSLSVRGGKPFSADVRETDADYFRVFNYKFLSGKPYTQEEFDAGQPRIVLDSDCALRLFGTTEATGKSVDVNGMEYLVSGVVESVSPLAPKAYAQAWLTTSSSNIFNDAWATHGGGYSVAILLKDKADEPAMRADMARLLGEYNSRFKDDGWVVINRNRPYDQETESIAFSANQEPDVAGQRRSNIIVYTILLLVPAVNLSSMTHSRLRRRVSEIAVRRAFGATRRETFFSLMNENLVITLLGGLIGLVLSLIAAFGFQETLFAMPYYQAKVPVTVNPAMLLQWSTFALALLFCFILNMLSAALPAMQMSRIGLVNALRGN